MIDEIARIQKVGITVTTGATSSAAIAIPTTASGEPAKVIRVVALSGGGYIKFGAGPASAGYQEVTFSTTITGTDPTGLANDTTDYTATITVDGVAKAISILGNAAQTFTDLINELNTDLGASATAAIVSGKIRVTSATSNDNSSVSIVDSGTNHLFASLTGFTAISPAVAGVGVVATANDILITVTPEYFKVAGNSYFAHIQETSAQKLNITPIEW